MVVYRPIRFVLRIIFYKGIIKVYSRGLKIQKRLGLKERENSFLSLVFHQKMVHVFVVAVTVLLIVINLTPKTRAGGLVEKAHKTILADLIQSEFSGFEEDEQFIIETFDKEATISSVQQSYLDNLDSLRPQLRVSLEDEEEESLDTLAIIQDGTTMLKPDLAATQKTKRARTETIVYVVKPGDSVSTIAVEFEVSVSTILWENNLSAYSIIRPGDKLTILPIIGISYKIAKGDTISSIAQKYKIDEEKILTANKLTQTATLKVGEKLMIPEGKKTPVRTYSTKSYTGFSAIKDIVRAPNARPVVSNKMNWPTIGSRITQYYSWRHHGLDIANKKGTAIYAADAGTVEYAGWGKGYGNQVVIDHGGGKKTRYAHLSKFFVKKGAQVSKGQTIASMGSTGWSTGSHLHFEVVINSRKYNPLNYIR